MGKRRIPSVSGNKATEHQEEKSNGRRYEAYDKPYLFVCALGLCISIVLVVPQWSAAEELERGCNHICWQMTVKTNFSFSDGTHVPAIKNEKSCKDVCANHEICIGTYWGIDATTKADSCWLQVSADGGEGSLSGANHSIPSNCTDDCLPYCWRPKKLDVKTLGGVLHRSVKTENQCKLMCSEDHMCDGVDWDMKNPTCHLLYTHRRTADAVNHWEVMRNLPTNCSKNEELCMPHCWTKVTAPDQKFNDGLLKKAINNEKDCKDMCGNNQTCTGVYWGFSAASNAEACYMQMPSGGESGSLTKVTYWTLSNCTADCSPFCWLPKWDHIQTAGGSGRPGITDENQCKVLCAYDKRCKGVDWNTTGNSCWILHELKLIVKPSRTPVHHWENERNLPTVCSSEPSVVSTLPPESENVTSDETGAEPDAEASAEPAEEPAAEPAAEEPAAEPGAEEPTAEPAAEPEAEPETEIEVPAGSLNGTEEEGGGKAETGESAAEKSREEEEEECPTYMDGIITLSILMVICVLIIVGLVTYIVSRTRPDPNRGDKPLTRSQMAFRSYQSIQVAGSPTGSPAGSTAGSPAGSPGGSYAGSPAGSYAGSDAGR